MMTVGRLWCAFALVGLGSLGLTGCASGGDALAADLDRLRSEVASLRSQNAALSERLGAVEVSARAPAPAAESVPGTASLPQTASRPRLEVVRLLPSDPDALASGVEAPPARAEQAAAPTTRVRYRSTSKGIIEEIIPLDEPATGVVVAQAKPTKKPTSENRPSAPPAGRSQ